MAHDDAAGAVRRTPRPALIAKTAQVLGEKHGFMSSRVYHDAQLLADADLLADPEQRRPVVLLPAGDCDCTPPYADCPHGPEPVDALELAVWLHAEAQHQYAELLAQRDGWWSHCNRERDALQGRLDAVRTVLDRPWPDDEDHHDFVNGLVEDARAVLQGARRT